MSSITIRIPAAQFADYDDCLSAAADAVAAMRGLQGWDLSPRWADEQRDEILVDVPAEAPPFGELVSAYVPSASRELVERCVWYEHENHPTARDERDAKRIAAIIKRGLRAGETAAARIMLLYR